MSGWEARLAFASILIFSGCSGPVGTSDAGTDFDAGTIVGGVCPNLPINAAPSISDSVVNMTYPGPISAIGGAIESGTYFETAHIYYQPVSNPGHSWQATLTVDGAAHTVQSNIARDGLVFQQTAAFYVVGGSAINLTITCPAILSGTNNTYRYTFTSGVFTLYSDADQTATVFQKQ